MPPIGPFQVLRGTLAKRRQYKMLLAELVHGTDQGQMFVGTGGGDAVHGVPVAHKRSAVQGTGARRVLTAAYWDGGAIFPGIAVSPYVGDVTLALLAEGGIPQYEMADGGVLRVDISGEFTVDSPRPSISVGLEIGGTRISTVPDPDNVDHDFEASYRTVGPNALGGYDYDVPTVLRWRFHADIYSVSHWAELPHTNAVDTDGTCVCNAWMEWGLPLDGRGAGGNDDYQRLWYTDRDTALFPIARGDWIEHGGKAYRAIVPHGLAATTDTQRVDLLTRIQPGVGRRWRWYYVPQWQRKEWQTVTRVDWNQSNEVRVFAGGARQFDRVDAYAAWSGAGIYRGDESLVAHGGTNYVARVLHGPGAFGDPSLEPGVDPEWERHWRVMSDTRSDSLRVDLVSADLIGGRRGAADLALGL